MKLILGIGVAVLSACLGCAGRYAGDAAVNDNKSAGVDKPAGGGPTGVPAGPLPRGVVPVKSDTDAVRLDAAGIIRDMLVRWADVRDYTGQMEKQEWLGGGVEPHPHVISERTRLSPKSLHFKWTGEKNKGRHALWVEGRDGGRMAVHPNPILGFGTMKIAPDSAFARTESKYDFRFGGLQGVMGRLHEGIADGTTIWTYAGEAAVYDRPTWRLTGVHPTTDPEKHHTMEMHVDRETLLPLFLEGRNCDGRLNIWVKFRGIRTNVGLTDADFDPGKLW